MEQLLAVRFSRNCVLVNIFCRLNHFGVFFVLASQNAESFRSSGQDESSITLQWNKVNNNVSFILEYDGREVNITAPDGDGPVTHTVSSLTAATKYTFTLFSVFENVRSSGVNITAVTGEKFDFIKERATVA